MVQGMNHYVCVGIVWQAAGLQLQESLLWLSYVLLCHDEEANVVMVARPALLSKQARLQHGASSFT